MVNENDLEQLARQIQSTRIDSDEVDNDIDFGDVKEQIRESNSNTNTFEDTISFENHIVNMRKIIEEEYTQKRKFRRHATYGAFLLVFYSVAFISLLFAYLVLCKDYIPSSSVLIGIAVSFVANIIGLATIVFKYVFSSTKETADYISKIDSHK